MQILASTLLNVWRCFDRSYRPCVSCSSFPLSKPSVEMYSALLVEHECEAGRDEFSICYKHFDMKTRTKTNITTQLMAESTHDPALSAQHDKHDTSLESNSTINSEGHKGLNPDTLYV
eukprot:Blabericola_migrator_1__12508@NODE_791_length_6494_cov_76_751361_g560_i0_p6_GENE_NODE_791_length_6494_cov_76_751361_g560_i0NODE_791_length_6494_cov_76_751361_g560_i0_p6_ORF_typecomplete_len118_score2_72TetR_C_6/PF13977_6/0_27_NODE_791_length_6494_cov_76_751361_g560_i055355888